MSECRSCGAKIEWITLSPSGKKMPIDPNPALDGNVHVEWAAGGAIGEVLSVVAAAEMNPPLYKSHFATCPHAEEHRQ